MVSVIILFNREVFGGAAFGGYPLYHCIGLKGLPLEGGRSARKMIQWIIFSEGRAAAPDGGLRGTQLGREYKPIRAARMR